MANCALSTVCFVYLLFGHGANLFQRTKQIAVQYYRDGDLYLFDEFQTALKPETRRPPTNNLYDVFVNIRDDEQEHVKTMVACQQSNAQLALKSPHSPVQLREISS